MTDRTALGKIVDIIRTELAPTVSREEQLQLKDIADAIEAIIMEEKLQEYKKQEALYKTKQLLDPKTIYDVLGSC